MTGLLTALTLCTCAGTAAMAGTFFAFSVMVMPALRRLPATSAIATMQSIDAVAKTSAFLTAFLGTAVLSTAGGIIGIVHWGQSYAVWLFLSALCYLLGVFAITMGANVPRNNALAELDPESPAADEIWSRFYREWAAWNHLRTMGGIASVVAAALALFLS